LKGLPLGCRHYEYSGLVERSEPGWYLRRGEEVRSWADCWKENITIIHQKYSERYSHPQVLRCSVVIASLCTLLSSLDSAVNIAFPAITAAFSLEVASIQWVVIGYVLTHASLLLGCGRLADLWGHGRLLTWGLLASAVAFVGCGLAPTFAWLIVARVGQGVAAALVSASAPALVTLSVPGVLRGRALGIFQMSAAAGYALGPLIGGYLVDEFGWRAVYLFRVLPALFLAWLAAVKLPPFREPREAQSFDLLGALTLAGSIAAFLLGISRSRSLGWTSPQVVILLLVSSMCFGGFLVTETRVRAPVVNLSLFRRPAFIIANLLTVLANCARFAIGLLMPYYVIDVLRYPATTGGSLMLAVAMMTTIVAPVTGRLSDRFGTARLSSLGLALEGLGLWMISGLDARADYLSLAAALGVVGLGLGVFEAPNMSFVMGAIPHTQQGVAGSISNMMRTLGIVFGATGASLLFDERRRFYSEQSYLQAPADFQGFVPAFQDVFRFAAGLCVLAFTLSLLRRREGAESKTAAKEN
jgi:EmrB/QacA subfamily drug resistance transporter